jgi:predicted 3-demethylubiquinone-9 3-methyltransferase (glyoxalase superfamily)
MQKITTCLWFDDQAEQAVGFYTSIFNNSGVISVSRYTDAGPGPAGSVMVMNFILEGQEFMALNGGPEYKFSPAISLVVNCKTQDEIDTLWAKLSKDGTEVQCGWVTDKYGVSWQIVPANMSELIGGAGAEGAQRAMKAMLGMKKLDIKALEDARDGR